MRILALAILSVVNGWGTSPLFSQEISTPAGQRERSSSQVDLAEYPDRPLDRLPSGPISPRFVIEHRSALHGKTVTVRGTVVRAVGPDDAKPAPGGGVTPRPGRFAQPRVFLVDAPPAAIDKNPATPKYELMVLLREGDQGYPFGQLVEIQGTVDGNRAAVVVKRLYRDI